MLSYDVVEWGKPLQKAEKATPKPAGTEVLLKLKYCGVCHSDVHIREGYFDLGRRQALPHERPRDESAGDARPRALRHRDRRRPRSQDAPIGQDRLVCPWIGCGKCARCAEGMDNHCMAPRWIGIQLAGGYADHLLVPHPKYLVDASGIDPAVGGDAVVLRADDLFGRIAAQAHPARRVGGGDRRGRARV